MIDYINYEAVVSDIKSRTGLTITSKVVNGKNGPILKVFPWCDLTNKWKRVHVECTPEKQRGNGYSIHLDFYIEGSITGSDAIIRNELLDVIEEEKLTALRIIGQPFELNPRPHKANVLVEQVNCVPFNAWARDAKIAELMAHYISAFTPAIARVSHS
ncbi:hypothetical protein LLG46_03680 [bacterium]|nr:hypothetical protein [bacterium]